MSKRNLALGVLALGVAAVIAPVQSVSAQSRTRGAEVVSCDSSGQNRENFCRADTRNGVALVRSRGRDRCVIGKNWGYDRRGIWVSNGCRGEFALGNAGNGYGWGWGNRFTGYVYCESEDRRRNHCAINTRGGVRLVNQVSRAACVEGRTWGANRKGIWVTGGCRGEFAVSIGGGGTAAAPRRQGGVIDAGIFRCESVDERDTFCRVPLDADRVEVVRQLSSSACVEGRTWGYRSKGIFVTRGCRADFRVVDYRRGPGDRRGGNRARNRDRDQRDDLARITCKSDGLRREYCRFPNKGVRLVREVSRSPCIEDRTWGHNRQSIWVDKGCEAVFELRER